MPQFRSLLGLSPDSSCNYDLWVILCSNMYLLGLLSRFTVVNHEAKKKQHTCTSSGLITTTTSYKQVWQLNNSQILQLSHDRSYYLINTYLECSEPNFITKRWDKLMSPFFIIRDCICLLFINTS